MFEILFFASWGSGLRWWLCPPAWKVYSSMLLKHSHVTRVTFLIILYHGTTNHHIWHRRRTNGDGGSSAAIQVGTAVRFPLASNCGQCFVCCVKFWWLCFFLLQQGVMLVPACPHHRRKQATVYLLLWVGSRLRGALRRVFPCVFPAPSNTSEILGSCCGCCISSSHKVVFAACAFPCSGFVYQILNISFLRFCYRHVFQRAFSFIFLNFHCLASRPLGQKGSRIFFCGVDDRKLHLLEKQVVQMWFCQLYAV